MKIKFQSKPARVTRVTVPISTFGFTAYPIQIAYLAKIAMPKYLRRSPANGDEEIFAGSSPEGAAKRRRGQMLAALVALIVGLAPGVHRFCHLTVYPAVKSVETALKADAMQGVLA